MTFLTHLRLNALIGACLLSLVSCKSNSLDITKAEDKDQSSHIEKRVSNLAMNNPREAIAIIDSAEGAGAVSEAWANKRRAMIYFNPLQEDSKVIECAKDVLENPEYKVSEQENIQLLRLMSNSYYFLGEYEYSIARAMQGERIAISIDSLAAQGEFKFIIGECMLKLGQVSTGYANMEFGITALSKAKGQGAKSTLSHLLGEEMTFMMDDGRFDEAISIGHRRESILEDLRASNGNDNYLDQQFAYLYGKMAFLYAHAGDLEKGHSYARKFHGTDYSRDKNGKLRIMEYLLESGQPRKVLDLFQGTDFPGSGDTISNDACYYLRMKAKASDAIGDYKSAYSQLDRSYVIADSLDRRLDKENALKVFTMTRAHEEEIKAKDAETKEARYLISLILIITLCIIIASAFLYYYYSTKSLVEKNRLITLGRSDTKEYIRLLQTAQARINELTPKGEGKSSDKDSWQLFLRLEEVMEKEHLYLDKGITRGDILDILGIGKNRLAQMFQDIGGELSLPTYINGKRLNHALEVISEHPEYTVSQIAEASGFSNSRNFHLLFKKRFGITPLQYRNGK